MLRAVCGDRKTQGSAAYGRGLSSKYEAVDAEPHAMHSVSFCQCAVKCSSVSSDISSCYLFAQCVSCMTRQNPGFPLRELK